jgi:hypothetical protein
VKRFLRGHIAAKALFIAAGSVSGCLSNNEETDIDVRWNNGPPVTAESSRYTDYVGREVHWSRSRSSDEIKLTLRYLCGDECGARNEIILRARPGQTLPDVVDVVRVSKDTGSVKPRESFQWMREGVVEIQDWSLDGKVSGRVTSATLNFDFWWERGSRSGEVAR